MYNIHNHIQIIVLKFSVVNSFFKVILVNIYLYGVSESEVLATIHL